MSVNCQELVKTLLTFVPLENLIAEFDRVGYTLIPHQKPYDHFQFKKGAYRGYTIPEIHNESLQYLQWVSSEWDVLDVSKYRDDHSDVFDTVAIDTNEGYDDLGFNIPN